VTFRTVGVYCSTKKTKENAGEIYTMDPDGTDVVRLTSNSVTDSAPNWNFYGNAIIFESKQSSTNLQLHTMEADGDNQTRFTSNSYEDIRPDW
jgi:Tol biopolymer transport system component